MMKNLFSVGIAGVLSLGINMAANAHGDMSEDAIEYREAVMEVIVWNFQPMGAMVKGKIPFDAQAFAKRAANLAALSSMPLEGFIPGTDKGDTDAKAEIWENWEDFEAKMAKFEEESGKLAEVAKTATSVEEVAPQFVNTAKTCKGCHKKYKNK
jgi:cytochrome c556